MDANKVSEGKNTFGDMLPKIERMIELLSPEGAWTQGACFRSKTGRPAARISRTFSRCIYGAMVDACSEPRPHRRALVNMQQASELCFWLDLRIPDRHAYNCITWNDREGRTKADILEFLHKCRNELRHDRNTIILDNLLGQPLLSELDLLEDA